jgi:hypothetical protein
MLIKGAAVLAHTDWKVARRPMDDLDLVLFLTPTRPHLAAGQR